MLTLCILHSIYDKLKEGADKLCICCLCRCFLKQLLRLDSMRRF